MSKPQLFQRQAVFHLPHEAGAGPCCQLQKGGQMWGKKEDQLSGAEMQPGVLCHPEGAQGQVCSDIQGGGVDGLRMHRVQHVLRVRGGGGVLTRAASGTWGCAQ